MPRKLLKGGNYSREETIRENKIRNYWPLRNSSVHCTCAKNDAFIGSIWSCFEILSLQIWIKTSSSLTKMHLAAQNVKHPAKLILKEEKRLNDAVDLNLAIKYRKAQKSFHNEFKNLLKSCFWFPFSFTKSKVDLS